MVLSVVLPLAPLLLLLVVPLRPRSLEVASNSTFEGVQAVVHCSPSHPAVSPLPNTIITEKMIKEVGGRLLLYAKEWHTIKPDIWVESVVTKGYKIEFTATPPIRKMVYKTPLPINKVQRDTLLEEVKALLLKKAIYPIFPPFEEGFWSTFFLAPKKTGDWRPILNLKPLNKYIKPKWFRMESLAIVLKAPIRGRWATSIDLKDAYLHIPINQDHQRWLRFHIKDQAYAFRCLPFGLSTAPRVFTRVVKAVGAFLRRQGVQIHLYLDDWLITSQSLVMAHRHTELVLRTLARLGFIVNLKKSHLQPTQSPIFLEARLDLLLARVYPSQERICNLIECARIFNQAEYAPAAAWLKLLGLMASMVELVPWCRFRMRPIQLHLLYHYRPNLHPLSKPVPLSHIVHQELDWWEMESNLLVGRVFPVPPPQLVVTTDASKKGWGGHLKTFRVSGVWSQDQSLLHINVLELLAVFNSLKALELQTDISEKKILIKSDNSTVVSYINRQGGTRSPTLCLHTRHLLIWCIQRGIFLTAVHTPGIDNTLADNLSRGVSLNPTEWSLAPQIVQTIFERVGIFPTMDLFATRHNKQTQVFCSRTWDEKAFAIDALSISWNRMAAYAFPPISLIYKVIQKIQEEDCVIILVAPFWPRQPWFQTMMAQLISQPFLIPADPDVLRMMGNPKARFHNVAHLKLTAWILSSNITKRRDFLKNQPIWSQEDEENQLSEYILRVCDPISTGVMKDRLIRITLL